MNINSFVEWLKRQGHQVYETRSSYWYDVGPKIYQSFPYDSIIHPDTTEIRELIKLTKAIAIRYSTSCNASEGKISYHVLFDGNEFSYGSFSKKVRHDIQHGLDYCEYKPISFSMMDNQGWPIREDTLWRQKRYGAETKEWWSQLCKSAEGLQGFEAWGAVKQNLLVASIFTYTNNGTASILYQQSLTDHLKYGINNTLAYVFVNHILNNKASRIFYGLHSLDAPSSVDEFKFRMGFRAQPVRQRIVINPVFAPLFNQTTYSGLKRVHNLFPNNLTFAKAEGMVRFYLQGKHPLSEQEWPEVLLEQKSSIQAQVDKA